MGSNTGNLYLPITSIALMVIKRNFWRPDWQNASGALFLAKKT